MTNCEPQIAALSERELRALVERYLGALDSGARLTLMAELPQTYATLYPGVDPAVILAAVGRGLNQAVQARREDQAAELDASLAQAGEQA